MHRIILFFLAFVIVGCAAERSSLTLQHAGGISGLSESYSVDQDGNARKLVRWPEDTLKIAKQGVISSGLQSQVVAFMKSHRNELDTIQLRGSGNLTTSILIEAGGRSKNLQWANLDPPHLATPTVDGLYSLLLKVEAEIASFPDIHS